VKPKTGDEQLGCQRLNSEKSLLAIHAEPVNLSGDMEDFQMIRVQNALFAARCGAASDGYGKIVQASAGDV